MKFELSQSFYFEAAHTLAREIGSEPSKRIHGHTYFAEVTVLGSPDVATGMIVDLGHFKNELARVRELLDHRLLDDVSGLGPATLENLCRYIFASLKDLPTISKVKVSREASGNSCLLHCV